MVSKTVLFFSKMFVNTTCKLRQIISTNVKIYDQLYREDRGNNSTSNQHLFSLWMLSWYYLLCGFYIEQNIQPDVVSMPESQPLFHEHKSFMTSVQRWIYKFKSLYSNTDSTTKTQCWINIASSFMTSGSVLTWIQRRFNVDFRSCTHWETA